MINSNWYEFREEGPAKRRQSPRVMLTKERRFRFNEKALKLIGSPKAVKFLFDIQLNRIGIRPVDRDEAHSFEIRKETEGQSFQVCGALFCNSLGIRPEHTIEFQSVRTDAEGTLLLDLTTAKRRVTSYRGGK